MQRYEYKVVPAPKKGTKAKGVKTPEGRFATSIQQLLNVMSTDGWEYQRAELLPSEERSGLTGSTTQWRNVLVFRRAIKAELPETDPRPVADVQVADDTPLAQPIPGPESVAAPAPISEDVNDPPLSLKEHEEEKESDAPEKA